MNGFWIFAAVLLAIITFRNDVKCMLGNNISCVIAMRGSLESAARAEGWVKE